MGQISAALAAVWKLEDTLEVITRITSQVMGVDSCSIYLQEGESDRRVLKATTGLAREAIGRASLLKNATTDGFTTMGKSSVGYPNLSKKGTNPVKIGSLVR